MPEEFYGLRPGIQEEVRTFGQHLARRQLQLPVGAHRPKVKEPQRRHKP